MEKAHHVRERGAMDALLREHAEHHLGLAAPEMEVLVRGPKANDRQVLRAAITELVVREVFGFVTIVEPRRFGPPKRVHLLTRGLAFDADVGPSLRAVLGVYGDARPALWRSSGRWTFGLSNADRAEAKALGEAAARRAHAASGPRGAWAAGWASVNDQFAGLERAEVIADANGHRGVPVQSLAEAVFRRYRHTGSQWASTHGFVRKVVLPELEVRGLAAAEPYRKLGLFRSTRWTITPAGTAAKADIERRLAAGNPARRGRRANRVIEDLRSRTGFLGTPETVDAVFKAIRSGVNNGWSTIYGGD